MDPLPDRPPFRWPASVRAVVEARGDRVAREATGRVVDLGVDHRFAFPHAEAVIEPHLVVDGTADHVVSVGALAASAHLPELLARVLAWLAEDGRLIFLEPVPDPTPRRRRPARPTVDGPVAPRDVTWALWEHGFAVTTADRVALGSAAAPLDRWVFGLARRRRMPRPTEALVADGRVAREGAR